MVLRHDDGIDAGRVRRAQARAEVARILDAVEHEQPQRPAALDDEGLEVADRELGRRRNLDDDALVHAAVRQPVEIGARHALHGDAARRERVARARRACRWHRAALSP